MQILPAIDLRGGRCVRLRQGDYNQETVFGDDPVEMAKRWASGGADRLHLVDLDGAKQGSPAHTEVLSRIVKAIDVPCQVGGGLRSEESIRVLLEEVGVDRVIVGTKALKDPEWFRRMTETFEHRVCLGIDAKDSFVATEGWLDVSQQRAIDLAADYKGLPVGALIYTNIANDGMMQGIDPQTIDDMIALGELGFPVIASGGVTNEEDVTRLQATHEQHPNLVGAIIGRALYEGTLTVERAVEIAHP